jgi:predicted enzyme related to lactoylglutathione lyase
VVSTAAGAALKVEARILLLYGKETLRPKDNGNPAFGGVLAARGTEVAMGNPFVHVELMSTDVSKSKAFYGSLFDWDLEDVPMPEMMYTMIKVGEGTGGGMLKNPMPGAPSSWMAYALVDDVRAFTTKARTLGAKVMKDVTEVPDMGWFSIITDPTGAMLGLWESKSR